MDKIGIHAIESGQVRTAMLLVHRMPAVLYKSERLATEAKNPTAPALSKNP